MKKKRNNEHFTLASMGCLDMTYMMYVRARTMQRVCILLLLASISLVRVLFRVGMAGLSTAPHFHKSRHKSRNLRYRHSTLISSVSKTR